ncbi:MAG: cysteine desulfurase family protein [Vulcanimicrobiota bacterium]
MIYLDYNATTPVDPTIIELVGQVMRESSANPTSSHAPGLAVRERVETARTQLAELLAASPNEILFTGGGTESNNLAVKGIAWAHQDKGRHLITSVVDHAAVRLPMEFLARFGFEVTYLPVDEFGRVSPSDLAAALRDDTILVSIMQAQNEVGTLQPIAELASLAHSRGALFHCDASQAVGKVTTRVDELGVDLLTVAGHKFYAPKGCGALYLRDGVEISPLLHGAGHERGLRGGTLNSHGIIALGEAARLASEHGLPTSSRLRDILWDGLREALGGRVQLNGHPEHRLPNTLNVSFAGMQGTRLLEEAGIAASTGAACHSGEVSPVLKAMGISAERARGAVRLSLGRFTTEAEVATAVANLSRAYQQLAGAASR